MAVQVKRQRALSQLDDLQACYLHMRMQNQEPDDGAGASTGSVGWQPRGRGGERTAGGSDEQRNNVWNGLNSFSRTLARFTQYSQLRTLAKLQQPQAASGASAIVSSIAVSPNEELFVTAGVSRRIHLFDYTALVQRQEDAHVPRLELVTRSKMSCLSWNKLVKEQIASSDHDAVVTVWDTVHGKMAMELEEHEKRVWSVDYNPADAHTLVSGGDDGKVKVWDLRQQASMLNIDLKANVCSVKYNPVASHYLAVGSADHHVHSYDMRRPGAAVCVFSGHSKAVSYVQFLSGTELASASTDGTLQLWDVHQNQPLRTLRGHTNEKNFVGLSVTHDFVACGSETNEVFVYHKQVSKPMAQYRFADAGAAEGERDTDAARFISAVCWKGNSTEMLAANSQGQIRVLTLAA